jgi:cellulose synthase/poly-beta-1,6-N-acetylglucosamine synthase-like glycosyltransferase
LSLFLQILLGGAALLVLFPVTVLFIEVLLAVTAADRAAVAAGDRPRAAVLVPAHNEELVIGDTLRSIMPQLNARDRLIVIADNCTDDTAALAAREGAEVIVRTNAALRGKGFALDFGVRHLELDAPPIVLIIDADCRAGMGSVDRLIRVCARAMRPIQSLYLMQAGADPGLKLRIAQFAWAVKNQVRPLGLHRLGLPCQLMGTGMAFPWSCISGAALATGHIVEDLKLGVDLARAGTPPLFCPEVLVTSNFPVSVEGIAGQRTRWEHGHLMVILNDAPRLLVKGFASLQGGLIAMALDLTVPPLALLSLLALAVWIASAIFYVLSGVEFPLLAVSTALALLLLAVLLSWARYGRGIISLASLMSAPLYAAWKIPLYARFLVSRQVEWVRSRRDKDGKKPGGG